MSTAIAYHTATKYHPETINQHPGLDWSKQPAPFKNYHAAEPIDLAQYLPLDPSPFEAADKQRNDGDCGGGIQLGALSRWLYFSCGVTAVIPNEPRPLLLRAAPSAGGLYPTECYVVIRARGRLEPGLYGFQPSQHQLIPLWLGDQIVATLDGACYDNAAVRAAPILMIVSGVFERSAWRYRERAYRRILLDSGHVIGNATLCAHAMGLRAYVTSAFCDERLNRLLRVDEDDEGVLAVVGLNDPGALERPSWSALPSPPAPRGNNDENLLLALHRGSRLPQERPRLTPRGEDQAVDLEARYGYAGGESLAIESATETPLADSLFDTIARRRSTRRYRRGPASRERLARILACAYAPQTVKLGDQPHCDKSLLMTFVAISDVDGFEPGVYYYAPHNQELRLLKSGGKRDELQFLCLGQELGGDAFAVVFQTAELARAVDRLGDRAYRCLHLDAGMLGQRLNLAAIAEGLGASGIGGFFDDHVNSLLGIPDDQAVVYVTTLGIPAETAE